ncbi:acyl carrier protein [Candidatus Pelagibacter sp.]|uniref:acyl carrier protein n=1 Tax=Candidatus Pelagibacter sp. TaxID=2024849 RepID=UPI003F852E4C
MKNATNKMLNLQKKLTHLIKEKLKIRDKKIDISKLGIGKHSKWDSLMHINILLDVEKTFNIRLTMKEMTEINSYKDIINKLKKK